MRELQKIVEQAWEKRAMLRIDAVQKKIRTVIEYLDQGKLRVAEPTADGWQVNEWVKKAVILYFPIQKMEKLTSGIFEYHDKIALKKDQSVTKPISSTYNIL